MNAIYAISSAILAQAARAASAPVSGAPLGWRPFIDPMPLSWFDSWIALWIIPLSLMVAVSYKAVRQYDLHPARFAREIAMMTVQIILGMIALAAASYVLVEVFVPWIGGQR
jgi:hypothetical protein